MYSKKKLRKKFHKVVVICLTCSIKKHLLREKYYFHFLGQNIDANIWIQ